MTPGEYDNLMLERTIGILIGEGPKDDESPSEHYNRLHTRYDGYTAKRVCGSLYSKDQFLD